MGKLKLACDFCGKLIFRYPSTIKEHNFCSRECLGKYSSKAYNPLGYRYRSFEKNSKRFTELNKTLNPTRMTLKTRIKLRSSHLGSESKGYEKTLGRHTHRVIAEWVLGRTLKDGEVVHHIDGNKRNNSPDNLMVFSSQAEHAAYHKKGVIL